MKRTLRTIAALLLSSSYAWCEDRDDLVAYLRIRIPAHTAPVTELAFAPDSQTLYSVGEDKVVHAWRSVDNGRGWRHSRTARWEVGYGKNGQIHALAIAPDSGRLAIGGHGNRGKHGELVWFAPLQLDRYDAWRFPEDRNTAGATPLQHEQVVASVVFSPEGRWFASADLDGRVLLWPGDSQQNSGELTAAVRQLAAPDHKQLARARLAEVRVRPIAWLDDSTLIYPKYESARENAGYRFGVWRLARTKIDQSGRSQTDLLPGKFYGQITAMAASTQANRLVVAGQTKMVAYDNVSDDSPPSIALEGRIEPTRHLHSVALSRDGKLLAVGRAEGSNRSAQPQGKIELWNLTNLSNARRIWQSSANAIVSACTLSPDGQQLAYASGNDVTVARLGRAEPSARTSLAGGPQVTTAGFLAQQQGSSSPYRIYVADRSARRVFDPGDEEMVRQLADNAAAPPLIAQSSRTDGPWTIEGLRQRGGVRLRRTGRAAVTVVLDPLRHGTVTQHCWIRNAQGGPDRIALGTELSNAVLVYQLPSADQQVCQLQRYFLGQEGAITSLGVSADQRYLISGSRDGTAAIWRLPEHISEPPNLRETWGLALKNRPAGGATVTSLDEQGPFYNRGLQVGDVLNKVVWQEGNGLRESTSAKVIIQRLRAATAASNPPALAFEVTTTKGLQLAVQVEPTWSPMLSLYSRGWDWIAWTPPGYYESSVQGDRLIGWQFTRTAGKAPLFATAERFYQQMRRPDLIKNLLSAGSLAKAVSNAGEKQIAKVTPAKLPVVRLLSPQPGELRTEQKEFELVAQVTVEADDRIQEVALLRDGVVSDRRVLQDPLQQSTQRWTLPLSDRDPHRFTVAAWGQAGKSESADAVIAQWTGRGDKDLRTLWLLAVGIADYPESVAQPLNYASLDAQQIADVFVERHAYDQIKSRLLTTPIDTTGSKIGDALQWLIESPDGNDLAVFYFAGHSSEAAGGDKEVSLLAIDGPDRRLTPSGLLQAFCQRAGLPKVIIIDSCRSGAFHRAITELARSCNQKSCGTSFFASSQADELSRESPTHHAGWLTYFVVQGLRGAAGTFGDWVTDEQLQGFVRPAVRAETRYKQNPVITIPQHPDRQELPLTIRQR